MLIPKKIDIARNTHTHTHSREKYEGIIFQPSREGVAPPMIIDLCMMRERERERECVRETREAFYFMHVMYTHTGPQGEKGELGPTGPPGLPGEKGARGKQGKRVSFSEVLRRTTTDQIETVRNRTPPPLLLSFFRNTFSKIYTSFFLLFIHLKIFLNIQAHFSPPFLIGNL